LIKNLADCYELFIFGLITCVVLIFFYNLALKYIPRILTWLSFTISVSWIVAIGYLFWHYAHYNYARNEAGFYIIQAVAYILWIFVFLFMMTVCCLWKSINTSV
jgi:hypothetical protein